MARQPLPIPLPVQPAPPLHLFPESNAATIAAASLESLAVSSSTWAADITASSCDLRSENSKPASSKQVTTLKIPIVGQMKIE